MVPFIPCQVYCLLENTKRIHIIKGEVLNEASGWGEGGFLLLSPFAIPLVAFLFSFGCQVPFEMSPHSIPFHVRPSPSLMVVDHFT